MFVYCAVAFRSSFSDFAAKYGKEERFKGMEKMRERENLFNEYILEVRKREKEEKTMKKEQVYTPLYIFHFIFRLMSLLPNLCRSTMSDLLNY